MRISDYIEQSFSNLWKKKLRTFLTTCGVAIGIGALVSMISFGKGVQKNITDTFTKLELFNNIIVSPVSDEDRMAKHSDEFEEKENQAKPIHVLDDKFIRKATKINGVQSAFPEVRFPAIIRYNQNEQFSLIQVLPADIFRSELLKLSAGASYGPNEPNVVIVSDSLLRKMKLKDPEAIIGQKLEISTLTFDLNLFEPENVVSVLQGTKLPFSKQSYTFTIVGVTEPMGFAGLVPLRSDVFISPAVSEKMKKISLTSIWDFFQSSDQIKGYSAVIVRVSSIKYIEPVKTRIEDWGFKTFALVDELREIKTEFIFMDMFLFAVGMIAITVASLGIINTMVMSILERYRDIGIMKAVGATDKDVKRIFFFESGAIGFWGGVFGLALGWAVSIVINQVINYFMAKQGVSYVNYFSFPWWLCLGAIAFSILISLAAGIYPASRAARVDPVVALRHD
jgi:putative ABC transport system permease protein